MNIVVLCAGTSTEREVSIVSGKMVCDALRSKGHNARVLDIYFGTYKKDEVNADNFFDGDYNLENEVELIKSYTSEIEACKNSGKDFFGKDVLNICKLSDVVFMALHGQNGEDGKVQATFDLLGIKYTGTGYLGSALAMDKGLAKQLFLQDNVPTPFGIKFIKGEDNKTYFDKFNESEVGFPCVVKPCCGGSSIGVSIAKDDDEFYKALDVAFALEDEILVEKYIKGREFSVGIIDGEALPIIEIIPLVGFYDYENKYKPGMTKDVCPAEISDKATKLMQSEAIHASKVLKLENYCRIDFLMDEEENVYCLEANTLPGMTPTSLLPQEAAVVGIDFPNLCETLIEKSLSK